MLQRDAQTVPITVVVPARPHAPAPHRPDSSLPFSGAPLEALTALGVAITVVGAAVVATVRRRCVAPRSYS
jgi:hypothetical protein